MKSKPLQGFLSKSRWRLGLYFWLDSVVKVEKKSQSWRNLRKTIISGLASSEKGEKKPQSPGAFYEKPRN